MQIKLELNIDFILFQESYININIMLTISYSVYYYIMLESEIIRLRVIIFAKKSLRF